MRKVFLFFLLVAFAQQVSAQQTVETRLGYSYNNEEDFSDEWQYLSTDLYLLNGKRFTRVLNELEKGVRKPKKNYSTGVESLFITAQLKNLKLFGSDEIVYPLYNFQVTDDGKEYKTQVSDQVEVVRIIDKMPLSAASSSIDAVIKAKAIANNEGDQVFNLVANQLLNISRLTTPSGAVLSLVGEFGSLLNARNARKEYKFSSTIRLYEGQNFDTRLHSVRVYAFVPSDVKAVSLKAAKLTDYLKKNPNKLDWKVMEELIAYQDYPVMVVANFKSLYKMDVLTGDEVNSELIEKRRQKVQLAYDNKFLNEEAYRQEKLYIEFLKIFAEMKLSLNSYRLNYRNNSPESNAKNLFGIVQEYKRLQGTFDTREAAFKENRIYQKVFRAEYEAILNNANLYLEADHNLKNGKLLVNTLRTLENDPKEWDTPAKREAALARLYAVELPRPEFLSASMEGEAILRLISKLEELQYSEVFAAEVSQLSAADATYETLPKRNALLDKAAASKCQSCREKVREAATAYNKRYESYKLQQALRLRQSLNLSAEQAVFKSLGRRQCIAGNLESVTAASTETADVYTARLRERVREFEKSIQALDQLNKQALDATRLPQVQEYNARLTQQVQDLEHQYTLLGQLTQHLSNCSEGS
ncbi:hypothetical protein ACXYMU_17090 [Pontibacter sp. CAU 1760]